MQPERIRILVSVTVSLAWLAGVVGPPLGLWRWRERRLTELAGPAVQADWDKFRADMRRDSGLEGPVQRKVPRSAEPPELVWLRDRFGLAVTAWVVLAGVPGAFLAWLVLGVSRRPRRGKAEVSGRAAAGPSPRPPETAPP